MDRREWMSQIGTGVATLLVADQIIERKIAGAEPAAGVPVHDPLNNAFKHCDWAIDECYVLSLSCLKMVETNPGSASTLIRAQFVFADALAILRLFHAMASRLELEIEPANPLFHPTVKLAADACDRCAVECQRPELATVRKVAEQF